MKVRHCTKIIGLGKIVLNPIEKLQMTFLKNLELNQLCFVRFQRLLVLFLQKMIKLNLQNNFVLKRQMKGCDFLRKTLSLIKNG